MTSDFFTTDDGDIVLRAGTEPNSKHDFRVHKFILSLASPVFKDMFTFPQPSDQTLNEHPNIPIVDIPDSPEVLDTILRYIYPGAELPKITKISILSALFSAVDKYNIPSMSPVLKESLKTFLPDDPFGVYIIACRFGFAEEKKQAAKLTKPGSFLHPPGNTETVQLISSTDLLRLVQFVQQREYEGRLKIGCHLDPIEVEFNTSCEHDGKGTRDYFSRLEEKVKLVFSANPCAGRGDLFAVLDSIPDPPLGCDPAPMSGDWYRQTDEDDAYHCPLRPMAIRLRLADTAEELRFLNEELLQRFFGNV